MTRDELEERLARRYWDRLRSDWVVADTGSDDPPEQLRWRIKSLVDDLYDLGVVINTIPGLKRAR